MKLAQAAAFLTVFVAPQVAFACNPHGSACGGSMGYASTFGVGIAAGILSILFERSFKKKS